MTDTAAAAGLQGGGAQDVLNNEVEEEVVLMGTAVALMCLQALVWGHKHLKYGESSGNAC